MMPFSPMASLEGEGGDGKTEGGGKEGEEGDRGNKP